MLVIVASSALRGSLCGIGCRPNIDCLHEIIDLASKAPFTHGDWWMTNEQSKIGLISQQFLKALKKLFLFGRSLSAHCAIKMQFYGDIDVYWTLIEILERSLEAISPKSLNERSISQAVFDQMLSSPSLSHLCLWSGQKWHSLIAEIIGRSTGLLSVCWEIASLGNHWEIILDRVKTLRRQWTTVEINGRLWLLVGTHWKIVERSGHFFIASDISMITIPV